MSTVLAALTGGTGERELMERLVAGDDGALPCS